MVLERDSRRTVQFRAELIDLLLCHGLDARCPATFQSALRIPSVSGRKSGSQPESIFFWTSLRRASNSCRRVSNRPASFTRNARASGVRTLLSIWARPRPSDAALGTVVEAFIIYYHSHRSAQKQDTRSFCPSVREGRGQLLEIRNQGLLRMTTGSTKQISRRGTKR